MTRKNVHLIAKALRRCRKHMTTAAYNATVETFATELRLEWPQFESGKFFRACYTTPTAETQT